MEINYREFLDLKTSQLILLHAIQQEPRSPREVVEYFALNFPDFYSENPDKGLIGEKQIYPMLRYLGSKEKRFITRDRSQRWMITPKGRGALVRNAFLTFRNVMQTIGDPYLSGLVPIAEVELCDSEEERRCLSIEPLSFPTFPSPVTKSRVQFLKKGTLFLMDLGGKYADNASERIKNLEFMQTHLSSLNTLVNVVIGELHNQFFYLNENSELKGEIPDNSIDTVLTHYLFALSESPINALKEIFRVLKPSQQVMMVEYTTDNSLFLVYQKKLFSYDLELPPYYQDILNPKSPRTKDTILEMISKTKFEVIEVVNFPNLPRIILKKPK